MLRRDDRFRLSHLGPLLCAALTARQRRPWIAKAQAAAAAVPDDWWRAQPPVFVVGFWRSGTTLLHELLAADRRFATPSLIDVLCPADAPYLLKVKRRLTGVIAPLIPATRLVDAVAVSVRSPQEEEVALCHLGAPSTFAAQYFPKRRDAILDEALFFEGAPEAREAWRAAHDLFLRLLAIKYPGRRLLLKNPANSTRLPELLARYPTALFVRIDRPADQVIPSFQRTTNVADAAFSLQGQATPLDYDAAARFHARVMAKLDADWEQVAPARRARVAYESFARRPLRSLAAIYRALDLDRPTETKQQQRRFWRRRARYWSPPSITEGRRPPGSVSP